MFNKKPAYSPAEISEFIAGIKTLEQLRSQAEQKSRLHRPEERNIYNKEYEYYTQVIHSAQLVLNKMLDKTKR